MSRALGRYELLRPLARGGMGEVYLARRRAAGVEKWLVVKRMRPERSGDTRFLDLFMREARLSMSLAHQNIVPVFDFGRIDDQVFLAMERVEGKDLGSSLARAGKGLPPVLAAFIAAECLQALDYAHRRKGPDGAELGIVHRDVTPRNVLLSWSGEVKLTDFGIAALAGDSPSRAAGTPAYMAPEQARGEDIDVRADVYAVGLVLREALTGERGRRGNDRETVMGLAKQGVLEPWPDAVDERLKAIVDRATKLDRTERYADARSMLEELDTFIVGERAVKKSDAPSRQLGAWLAEVWKDAREDEGALDAQIEAGVMVSFLDDGPLDVIGTGTQRSALATAADEAASASASAPKVDTQAKADAPPTVEVSLSAEEKPASPAPAVEPARKRSPALLVTGGIAVVAVAALAWKMSRKDEPAQQHIIDTEPSFRDGATVQAAAPDAATSQALEQHGDQGIDAAVAVVAERTPDAGVGRVRPHPQDHDKLAGSAAGSNKGSAAGSASGIGAGSGSAVVVTAPPATGKRKVTINAKPWSNLTIDGGDPHASPYTVELTPGEHTIHFTGQPYFKADKTVTITVPDRDGFTYFQKLEAPPEPPTPKTPSPAPAP